MMRIECYQDHHRAEWDSFVQQSKNGTFLFLRDYMEYHRDRFRDHSLLVRDDADRLIALLPANVVDGALVSHGGLTYGGFVTDAAMKTPRFIQMFYQVMVFLKTRGFTALRYKTVPPIYHRLPADEDRYALFLANAQVIRRGLLTVVAQGTRPPTQQRRARGVQKAIGLGVTTAQSSDFDRFWPVLTERLRQTHGVRPVHSLAEIRDLHTRFPDNIKLFAATAPDGELIAGAVIYESPLVAHCQYVASSERGRALHAIDLVFNDLLAATYAQKPYFDFGTSDEEDGRRLNQGLVEQKEGFGARAVVHDHYAIDLTACDPARIAEALA